MSLQIIGSGFGRTGTKSLKDALEMLGFAPCHHMYEVLANPPQVVHWQAIAEGRPVDWNAVFEGYAAQVDWPGAHVWRETSAAFPDAKVIHSHRPTDVWWASFSKTIGKLFSVHDGMPLPPHVAAMLVACDTMIRDGTFGGEITEDSARAAYETRLADVRAAIPADRLLVYDVAEGWGPLCAFLDVPEPTEPFPHMNRRKDFWEAIGGEPA